MKVKEVTAVYKRKYGLPKYSNIELSIGMKAEIDKNESTQSATNALLKICKKIVEDEGEKSLERFWKGKEKQREKWENPE